MAETFEWVMDRCDICEEAPEPCVHCWKQRAEDAERVINAWLDAGIVTRERCTEDHDEYDGADQGCCEGAGWYYYHGELGRVRAHLDERTAQRDALEAACRRLMAAYEAEEDEDGFPFNFELRDAHRALGALLADPTEDTP